MAFLRILRGPVIEQHAEGLRFLRTGPIELRRQIVHPAALDPEFHVGVELVVLAKTGNTRRPPVRPTDAKRADPEAHVVLLAADAAVERLDELIHVLPPPVGAREFAAGREVTLPRGAIGEFEIFCGRRRTGIGERSGVGRGGPAVGNRVGIKIIVEVDAIEIVVADDFAHDIERAFLGHGFTGVHPHQLAVGFDHAGVRLREMARVEFGNRALVAGAVGIEPRVQLETPTVRGGDPLA